MEHGPSEEQLAELLDDYLSRLQRGERVDREAMVQSHPQLESALRCLEALEAMAPPRAAGSGQSDLGIQLPASFGEYELLEELGRGGMGVVYKARQRSLDRVVAIKMILAHHFASPELVRRFHAEARAAAGLRHPHIVDIYDVGEVAGQHYFAMEYVEGPSLAERLQSGPLDVLEAARITAAVARAVGYLHRQGIVHRDLKPSNILLDADGRPYVTDFGLAKGLKEATQLTATGMIAGTPSYMAPEQAAGRTHEVGPLSDVYSLGAILYELLTGRPPFRQDSPVDTLMQVLHAEPTLPRVLNPRVPRALQLICMKCLAKSPGDRYPSADALAEDLEHFLKGEALNARPPSLVQRLQRWARREPALASRLAVLAVFFFVEYANYRTGVVELDDHPKFVALMAVWAAASWALQRCLRVARWAIPAHFLWGLLDCGLLSAALLIGNGAASPLVVAYPMLIAGSGLWFRVRFVSFMTLLCLVSYGLLLVDFYFFRSPGFRREMAFAARPDRHVMFAIMLVVVGAVVAFLVHRVRMLTRYYGPQE